MSADDPTDPTEDDAEDVEPAELRAELDRQRGHAGGPGAGGEDLIDLLSAAFDTDKRTRVYVGLRRRPDSTPEELAEETGLYPATVERVLDDLGDEGVVERRAAIGDESAEYTAIAPHEVVDVVLGRVQDEIDRRFRLGRSGDRELPADDEPTEPVTIPVEKDSSDDADDLDNSGQ